MSRFQLDEVSRVLRYPKIHKLLGWSDGRIESFIRQLMLRVDIVEIEDTVATVPDDPADAPILATLIASSADVLITGDSDLLALRDRYPIEFPAQFVCRL